MSIPSRLAGWSIRLGSTQLPAPRPARASVAQGRRDPERGRRALPDGDLFAGIVLGTAERHTPQARAILWAFNRKGDFDNLGDTAAGLPQILEEPFQTVEVDVIGSIAHFTATGPRQAG